ncbi:MAG: hypothetical protein ABR577_01125 [Pyrinomonadaceae bacterium]
MKRELEALDRASEIAGEIEIGLAELAQNLSGEQQAMALRLRDEADKLADSLTAVYLKLAGTEAAQAQAHTPETAAPIEEGDES